MWKASRCAVRLPMPGSLPSSVTSRWRGGASNAAYKPGRPSPPRPPRAAQPAGRGAHLVGGELLRRAQRLVDGGQHGVLQHLDVLGVDGVGVDGDRLDGELAGGDDLDHAAAGRCLDALVLERLLRGRHVLLHLLDLLEHLLHVRLGRHQDVSSGSSSGRISASNSSTNRSISSSADSVGLLLLGRLGAQLVGEPQAGARHRADGAADQLAVGGVLGLALREAVRLRPRERQLTLAERGGPGDLEVLGEQRPLGLDRLDDGRPQLGERVEVEPDGGHHRLLRALRLDHGHGGDRRLRGRRSRNGLPRRPVRRRIGGGRRGRL